MQENTNKAIVFNSIIMNGRMLLNTILALFTTRFALQSLGVTDYGLFSVLGSIISFISVFNTIMLSTCNRFLAVAVGHGDIKEINKSFNVNLIIFIGCALMLLFIGLPIGDWYIRHYINYDGPLQNALMVFYFTIIGSVVSTIATPFNGLLMAKERFLLVSIVDVVAHVIRFLGVVALLFFFENKLLVYTILQTLTVALPTFVVWIYCKIEFADYVRITTIRDKNAYKEVFKFSGWVSIGAISSVVRSQAAALIVNNFFNTVMNTALGIANSLNQYVMLFANNVTQPMQPQITKSYATGNFERTNELLVMSTKFSFLMMLLIGSPFFVSADWLLSLWLGQVPPYAVAFTILLIIDNLVMSFNSGLSLLLFADGRIALYQIVINTLRLASVVAGYFVLRTIAEPKYLFYTYILFSVFIVIATQWVLYKTLYYNNKTLIMKSYIPSLLVLVLFLPTLMLPVSVHPIIRIIIAMCYLLVLEFFIGLSKKERFFIVNKIKRITV